MKNLNYENKYFFFLIYLIYLSLFYPIWLSGELYYDDWSVAETGSLLGFKDAFVGYLNGFITRPFGAIILAIISQIKYNFQLAFFLNLSVWFCFCLIIFKVFKKITDENFSIIFFVLILFPNFNFTNLISPYAQSLGIYSLLFWSISLFFTLQYYVNRKIRYLTFSIIFFFISVLTYEITFPLIVFNFFIKYFLKNDKFKINTSLVKKNLKEIIIIILITLSIILYQKVIVNFFDFNISNRYRFKFNNEFLSVILNYYLIPLEILLGSFKLLFSFEIKFLNFNLFFLVFFLIILNKTQTNFKPNINFYFLFLSFYFFFLLFFVVAGSLPTIYGYYNRAMGAYNFMFTLLILVMLIKITPYNIINKLLLITYFLLNFFSFSNQIENHSITSKKRKEISNNIVKQFKINQKNIFVFSLIPSKLENDFNGEWIFSEEVEDFSRSLKYYSNKRITGKRIYFNSNCKTVLNYINNEFWISTPSRTRKSNSLFIEKLSLKDENIFFYNFKSNKIFAFNDNKNDLYLNLRTNNFCN